MWLWGLEISFFILVGLIGLWVSERSGRLRSWGKAGQSDNPNSAADEREGAGPHLNPGSEVEGAAPHLDSGDAKASLNITDHLNDGAQAPGPPESGETSASISFTQPF